MKYIVTSVLAVMAATASADQSFSIYLGAQGVADATADVVFSDGSKTSFDTKWEGKSFEKPVYYGMRYTNWQWGNFGWALQFTHSKAYPTDEMLARTGFRIMEFTDGINVLTGDLIYRYQNNSRFTPYIGGGVGISIPHVELNSPRMKRGVYEYQYGGFAATALIGTSYEINEEWSAFVEGKFDHVPLDVDMNEGTYKTVLNTAALNFGMNFNW